MISIKRMLFFLCALVAISFSSCSDIATNPTCIEGDHRFCDCPDGTTSEQVCTDKAWSDCDCESTGDVSNDPVTDTGDDLAGDGATDATNDPGEDGSEDAAEDTGEDGSGDVAEDTGVDGSGDVAEDTGVDESGDVAEDTATPEIALTNNGLEVNEGTTGTILADDLLAEYEDIAPGEMVYTVGTAPLYGTLYLDDEATGEEDLWDFTQEDIDDGILTYTHDGSEVIADTFEFSLEAGEGGPTLEAQTFELTINPVNDAPTITTSAPITATEDVAYSYYADMSDPDGPSEAWRTLGDDTCGGSITPTAGVYTFTPAGDPPPLTCVLSIEACDGHATELCAQERVTVTITSNRPPTISTTGSTAVIEDVPYSYDADATDVDSVSFVWTKLGDDTCPSSAIVSDSGLYTFSVAGPVPAIESCVLSIQVCDDGSPSRCDTETRTITVVTVNDAPQISGTPGNSAIEDIEYTFTPGFLDPDGPGQIWSRPDTDTCGGAVNGSTGEYKFTAPGPVPIISCVLTLKLCDSGSPSECDDETVTVSVTAVNDPPVIISPAPNAATEDAEYRYQPEIDDPDGPGQTWSRLGADTCGGNLNATTGIYTFTPSGDALPASCVMSIQVCDGGDESLCGSKTETIQINHKPVISPIPDLVIPVADGFARVPFTVEDDRTDPSSLTVVAASDNLTVVTSENLVVVETEVGRELEITLEPGVADSATITVTVTDGDEVSASTSFVVTVVPCSETDLFDNSVIIELYEPCAEMSEAFPDSCFSAARAREDGSSSWRRTDEPVEIPLVNGYVDASVLRYYPFDGGSPADASIHGAVSIPLGGPSLAAGVFGDEDGAMAFDGDGDVLITNYGADQSRQSAISFLFWFQTTATEGQFIGQSDEMPGSDFIVGQVSSGALVWTVSSGLTSGANTIQVPPGVWGEYADGDWHHAAFVKEQGSGVMTMHIFLDGRLMYVQPIANEGIDGTPLTQDFFIGGQNDGGVTANEIAATMDDVLIIGRAFSPNEVAAYYASHRPYGTSAVPGARPDFVDIRVTEQAAGGDEERILHEVVGARPHSDLGLDGVLAYWRFDDGIDDGDIPTEVFDETLAHNGTNTGGTSTTGRFGDTAGALRFDGNDYIDTGYAPAFEKRDSFTIEVWARMFTNNGHIFGLEEDSATTINLYDVLGSGITASIADDLGTPTVVWLEDQSFNDGVWHHFALVRDVARDVVLLYVDGVEVGRAQDESTSAIESNGATLFIGALNSPAGTTHELNGEVDEVLIHGAAKSPDYIFNRANPYTPMLRFLASTEGTTPGDTYAYHTYRLYWGNDDGLPLPPLVPNPGAGAPCEGLLSPCNGYVGWWRFEEGGGTVAIDATTSRGHGAVVGSPMPLGSVAGTGYSFLGDGTQYVDLPDDLFHGLDEVTYGAIVFRASAAAGPVITAGTKTPLGFAGQNDVLMELDLEGGDLSLTTGADTVAHETWLDLAVTYGGANPILFLGETTDIKAAQDDGAVVHDGATRVAGSTFGGRVDEVRVFSRALTRDALGNFPTTAWSRGDAEIGACVATPAAESTACADDGDCLSANCSGGLCTPGGWVRVPAGTFCMGSPDGETACQGVVADPELGRSDGELLHEVTLTHAFYILDHEVTQGEWLQHFSVNPSEFDECGLDCPVEMVNWWEAIAYANALSVSEGFEPCYSLSECDPSDAGTGIPCTDVAVSDPDAAGNPYLCEGYRLPMEAEWEYVSRAGTTTAFYSGDITTIERTPLDGNLDLIAWYGGNSGVSYSSGHDCSHWGVSGLTTCGTHDVGGKVANDWGVYDMAGNVYEWVWDWHDTYPTGRVEDPLVGTGSNRVKRGGGWSNDASYCRGAVRLFSPPGYQHHGLGFRPARTLFDTCFDSSECSGFTPICGPTGVCQAGHENEPCGEAAHCSGDDLSCCSGLCVDPLTNPDHCGACERPCLATEPVVEAICAHGLCESTCLTSAANCSMPSAPDPDDGCESDGDPGDDNAMDATDLGTVSESASVPTDGRTDFPADPDWFSLGVLDGSGTPLQPTARLEPDDENDLAYQVCVFFREDTTTDITSYTCGTSDECKFWDASLGIIDDTDCSDGSDGFIEGEDLYGCCETDLGVDVSGVWYARMSDVDGLGNNDGVTYVLVAPISGELAECNGGYSLTISF